MFLHPKPNNVTRVSDGQRSYMWNEEVQTNGNYFWEEFIISQFCKHRSLKILTGCACTLMAALPQGHCNLQLSPVENLGLSLPHKVKCIQEPVLPDLSLRFCVAVQRLPFPSRPPEHKQAATPVCCLHPPARPLRSSSSPSSPSQHLKAPCLASCSWRSHQPHFGRKQWQDIGTCRSWDLAGALPRLGRCHQCRGLQW